MHMEATDQTPEWIAQVVAQNPIQMVDEANVRSCPVRLSFPNLFRPTSVEEGKEPTFNVTLLFPPVDISLLHQVAGAKMLEAFPNYLQNGQWLDGLEWPFKDQAAKAAKLEGYTSGSPYLSISSKYRPAVVDSRQVPIIDEARVYPGVWGLAVMNCYDWNYKNMKRGVSFGLQTLMILADDRKLGGGAVDTATAFAGVHAPAPQAADMMPHGNVAGAVHMPPGTAPMAPPAPLAQPPAPAAPPAMAPPATAYAPPAAAAPPPAPAVAPAPAPPAVPVGATGAPPSPPMAPPLPGQPPQ